MARDWTELHKRAIKEMGFEVGDEVKCRCEFGDNPLGIRCYGTASNSEKKNHIGKVGRVHHICEDGSITLKYDDGEFLNFPWHVLELVGKAPKATTLKTDKFSPIPAKVDISVATPFVEAVKGLVEASEKIKATVPKFKVGDRVKVQGRIGWLHEADSEMTGWHFRTADGQRGWAKTHLLGLYPPPKLKVGDEVTLLRMPLEDEELSPWGILSRSQAQKNVGKTGEVLSVIDEDTVHVGFPGSFPFYCSTTLLEKVEKKPNLEDKIKSLEEEITKLKTEAGL
jgi:hypothetical protein